jgi:hypothetical protein
MDAIGLLRSQFSQAHQWLDVTLGDVTGEQLHWYGDDGTGSAAAQYAHAVISEDLLLNMFLRGAEPLMMSSWVAKTGLSEPPPMDDWSGWSRSVRVDLDQFREYAQAVRRQTDEYLASLTEEELDREFDSAPLPFGIMSVARLLNILHGHVYMHAGEISVVKGLQGLQGYPV